MTSTTSPRTPFARRTVSGLVAVSATMALLLSACGDDPSTAAGGAPISTVVDDVASTPPVIAVVPGASGASTTSNASADGAAPAPEAMTRLAWIEYVLGIELPALDGDSPAWQLIGGDIDPARVAALAAALGLSGDPTEQPADWGGGWIVGPNDGTAPSLTVSADGMLSWWYSSNSASGWRCVMPVGEPEGGEVAVEVTTGSDGAVEPAVGAVPDTAVVSDGDGSAGEPIVVDPAPECIEPEPPTGVPTADEAEDLMRDLLATWGVDVDTVELETYADEWNANVTAYLVLDGQRTPITWGASFGAEGELMYANGVLADVQRVADYPRTGTAAAFERLQSGTGWWGGGLVDPAVVRGAAETADAGASDVMPGAPVEGEPITVTITGVEEELWMLWDADGVVWLVPGYTFIGDDGGRYSVPAIADEYLDIQEPVVEPMPVDSLPVDETPVEPAPGDGGAVDPGAPADLPVDGGIQSLVGLSEDEAVKVVEGAGWTTRVVARDGERFAVTMDYRMDRVNLEIVDGVVTVATIG